ncbi:PDC sensor domain-containing protein [Pseudoduganella namucuonensis]|uniref:Cache domain-containing protein n=1 Tax=Pseudoduganella namucuonensis TaxID=1035707 RepID=A0A1I7M1M0_9BURK|nr:PDC sensor domain-containing protein [Pseudoduganella namucuonensis]SFV15838.1 hypothetical protein SAMN05216552_104824 [Pseudoduganella namucuonensis]
MVHIAQKSVLATALAACMAFASCSAAAAEAFSAPLQAKVEKYKKKLVEWAADPAIVAAVKEANSKSNPTGMTNSKWVEVEEKSPAATAFSTSKAGALVKKWEEDQNINKLVVRDEKGNLVAASTKPLLFNNAVRPVYIQAIKGETWAATAIAPDPTTQIKSVQASAPVFDGKKVIGVIHAGITSE